MSCKYNESPYGKPPADGSDGGRAQLAKVQKLSEAMELIRQAFSLETCEAVFVMGKLYDLILEKYPDKARRISSEEDFL